MYNFKRKSVRLVSSAKGVQEGMRMGPVVGYLEQKSSEKKKHSQRVLTKKK